MAKKRKRRRRYFAPLWVLAVVTCGIGCNIYVALRQDSVQAYVREALDELIANPFEMDGIELSIDRGAEVSGFRILTRDGSQEIVTVERIRVVPRVGSLVGGTFAAKLVVIDNLEIRLSRDARGRFNIQDVLRPQPPSDTDDHGDLPNLVVRGCKVRYVDETREFTEEIDNLEFSLTRDEERVYSFDGELEQDFADSLLVSGQLLFTGAHPSIDLCVRAFKVDVTESLTRLLPHEVSKSLESFQLGGQIDIEGDLALGTLEGVVLKGVGGRLIRCRLAPEESPFPIESLSGDFFVGEHTIKFHGLRGKIGGGELRGHGFFELTDDRSETIGWGGKISLENAPVDGRWFRRLSEQAKEELAPWTFQGTAGGSIEVASAREFPPKLQDITASLELAGVDIRHEEFPHAVTDVRGSVRIEGGELVVDKALRGVCAGGRVTVPIARFDLTGTKALDVSLRIGGDEAGQGIELDERCRESLPEDLVELWDDFQLRGQADARIHLWRDASSGSFAEPKVAPLHGVVRVFPQDVRIAHVAFPYEVERVTGEIVYDSRDDNIRLKELHGFHGEQRIYADGSVELSPEESFEVVIRCDDLPADDDLLAAVGEESRAVVREFGFEGRMKIKVIIESVADGDVSVETVVDLHEARVRPVEFPYPLVFVGGRITIHDDHYVNLEGISTAESARPFVRLEGSLLSSVGERTFSVKTLEIARLAVDDQLRSALPKQLREFVDEFGLQGTYSGVLNGWYTTYQDSNQESLIFYEGSNIRSDDAAVDFGLKISEISGTGRFRGSFGAGRPNRFAGAVDVSSAWFNRLHLTGGEIDFAFGEPHFHVKADREGQKVPERDYTISTPFLDRLTEDGVASTFQLSAHSEDIYGGVVDGFLFVDTGDHGDLGGHFTATGIELSKASKDIFGVASPNTQGKAHGHVQFSGRTGDLKTVTGKGLGVIEDAQLVELPLFFGLLSILKLDLAQAPKRSFFNEVRLPYEIKEGKFHASDMQIKSPSLSLTGRGTLDFGGNLELVLRPQVVDTPVPIWDQIVGLVKDALVRVRITGDLAEPKVDVLTALGLVKVEVDTDKKEGSGEKLPSDLEDD